MGLMNKRDKIASKSMASTLESPSVTLTKTGKNHPGCHLAVSERSHNCLTHLKGEIFWWNWNLVFNVYKAIPPAIQ